MNGNEYQELVGRTLLGDAPFRFTKKEASFIHARLEMATTTGKEIDDYKKQWFHNHGATKEGELENWDSNQTMLLWNIFGLIGEAAEAADVLLNWLADDGESPKTDYFIERMAKELGDVSWYLAAMATKSGLKLNDIMEGNIVKLKARYPEGFTSEHSNLRLDGEPLCETPERDRVLALAEEGKEKENNQTTP